MPALIGTVTTAQGVVHAVAETHITYSYDGASWRVYTACQRTYSETFLDVPDRMVTCVYCVIGKPGPRDASLTNPCGEIEIDLEAVIGCL